MAGFLPFSAIYIELYYIFASIWGHKVYTIYSILFIVFLILIVVTAFITVALTYFQLAVEDHRWWWRSFMCGGSTAFFVLGYCFFYYHYRYVCTQICMLPSHVTMCLNQLCALYFACLFRYARKCSCMGLWCWYSNYKCLGAGVDQI